MLRNVGGGMRRAMPSAPRFKDETTRLQRAQEIQDVLLLRCGEPVESGDHRGSFRKVAAYAIAVAVIVNVLMHLDYLRQVSGTTVMHEEQPLAEAPEGSGTELVSLGPT